MSSPAPTRRPGVRALQWVVLIGSVVFLAALLLGSEVSVFQYQAF